jgi:benzoate/toluate 1,2-dioxygenase alpha subunit
MSRGAEHWLNGPDEVATALGMDGVISAGARNEDEGLYPIQHGYWLQTMRAAVEKQAGASTATSEG